MDFLDGIETYLAGFSAEERAVSGAAFALILAGRPVLSGVLATALAVPRADVDAALDRLGQRGGVVIDEATGEVTAARGLSRVPTAHVLDVGGRRLYTLCAIDAVGIPAALGLDARVASRCHGCGAAVTVAVRDGLVREAPAGLVVWAAGREPARSLSRFT